MDLPRLTQIAIQAARSAGALIQRYKDKDIKVDYKQGTSSYAAQVVTEVDQKCEAAILSHLLPTCQDLGIALLSEETEDDGGRFQADYFWCVDPIDGTLPFIQKRPGFSVSIALVAKDGLPQIGVVFDPSTETLYHASKGEGAFKNGLPWKVKLTNQHLTYVTDRQLKDTPQAIEIEQFLQEKTSQLGLSGWQELAGAGSVLNAIRVLEHGPALMLKYPKKEKGGGSIWDYAATACIFQELGLPATNFKGGKLDLNKKEGTFMNHEGVFFTNLPSRKI
jgi:fructose-1,6-bisphosphatase/inositol monophosphatase family enzyme